MKPIIFTGLLLVYLLSSGCAPSQDFDARLDSIVKPYLFSITWWEARTIPDEIKQWIFGGRQRIDDETGMVIEYFASTERMKTLKTAIAAAKAGSRESDLAPLQAELDRLQERTITLESVVERIVEKQI